MISAFPTKNSACDPSAQDHLTATPELSQKNPPAGPKP